jgi:hypothetical protein
MAALVASLMLGAGGAAAQPAPALDRQITEIREVGSFVPKNALAMLLRIEAQGRAADTATKAEFLYQLSLAHRGVGKTGSACAGRRADRLADGTTTSRPKA